MAMMQGTVGEKYGAQEYGIEESIRNDPSDSAMRKRFLKTREMLNHGSGTCSMGTVVDTECRVKGTEGLRVIDVSVFPMPIRAHYQAAVCTVAEQVCATRNSWIVLTRSGWRKLSLMLTLLKFEHAICSPLSVLRLGESVDIYPCSITSTYQSLRIHKAFS
jgi:hypothetical protein